MSFSAKEGDSSPEFKKLAEQIARDHLALKKVLPRSGVELLDISRRIGGGKVCLARLKFTYSEGNQVAVEFESAKLENKKDQLAYPLLTGRCLEKLMEEDQAGVLISRIEFEGDQYGENFGYVYEPEGQNLSSDLTYMIRSGYSLSPAFDHGLATTLARRGRRVVLFDYPGHCTYSRSLDKVDYRRLTLNDYVVSTSQKIAQVRQRYGGTIAFVGQSMSGRVGLNLFANGSDSAGKPDQLSLIAPFGQTFIKTEMTWSFLFAIGINLANLVLGRNFALTAAMAYRYFYNQEISPSQFAKYWDFVQPEPNRLSWELVFTALGQKINNFLSRIIGWYNFPQIDIPAETPIQIIFNGCDVMVPERGLMRLQSVLEEQFGLNNVCFDTFPSGVHNSQHLRPKEVADLILKDSQHNP